MCLSEKCVIAIVIALNLWIFNVCGQECALPDGGDLTFINYDIIPGELFENPIEIPMLNTVGVTSYKEEPSSNENYFSLSFNSQTNIIEVMTTSEFLNYEKDQTQTDLVQTVTLNCEQGSKLMILTFNFLNVNHFAPEFRQNRYEIEIPLPLPKGINIFAIIGDRISAIDYDLQNNQIMFESDMTQPFKIATSSETATKGKEYFATIFTTEKLLSIGNGIEFTIKATDSGENELRSATVDVKLVAPADYDEISQIPIFVKPLYNGTLDFRRTKPLSIETISLLDRTFSLSITFDKDMKDGGEYFEINRNNLDNAIEIILKSDVTENDFNGQTQLSFVVTAMGSDDLRGFTVVMIDIIPRPIYLFDKVLYTGLIKLDKTIDHDVIKLTDDTYQSDVQFTIDDDHLEWFEVIFNPSVNEMIIKLNQTLPDTEFNGKTLVALTISATSTGNTVLGGISHLGLGIEQTVDVIGTLVFEKAFYEGYISADLEICNLDPLKLIDTTVGDIQYTLSDYSDVFETVKIAEGVQIIKKKLVAEDIADRNHFRFIVTATNDIGGTGLTVVILSVERAELDTTLDSPAFDEETYLISVIVLAAILLLTLIFTFIMWWKLIRPYRFISRGSSKQQLENYFDETGYTEPVTAQIGATNSNVDLSKKSDFEINNENAPNQKTQAKTLLSILDMDNRKLSLELANDGLPVNSETNDSIAAQPPKEPKKSIKFNETVERIDILDDFDQKEYTSL